MASALTRRQFFEQSSAATLAAAAVCATTPLLAAETEAQVIVDCHQHLWDLSKFKLPWLTGAPKILHQTYHIPEYRTATLVTKDDREISGFVVRRSDAEVVLARLERAGVHASSGAACSAGGTAPSHVLLAMGESPSRARGGVRLSLARTTTDADIDIAIDVLCRALSPLLTPLPTLENAA